MRLERFILSLLLATIAGSMGSANGEKDPQFTSARNTSLVRHRESHRPEHLCPRQQSESIEDIREFGRTHKGVMGERE